MVGIQDYIREGVPLVKTTGHVETLPSHSKFGIVAVANKGRILMVKNGDEGRGWEYPGGKCRENEEFLHAAAREFREETGYELLNPKPICVVSESYVSENHEHHADGVVYTGKVGEKKQEREDKIENVKYFEELPDDITEITFDRSTFREIRRLAEDETTV